ncbi:hypothetical protein QQF64_035072 [Cirrhinus molitorella]|uniref:Uncharacterized protein n=1 Tax=Cirrhinus molitorella TaxID=172907 RepID=A0ABR3NER4_9TELE
MNILDDIGQSSSMVGEDVLRGSLKRLDKGASLSALWSEMAKTAHEPNPPACCTPAKLEQMQLFGCPVSKLRLHLFIQQQSQESQVLTAR